MPTGTAAVLPPARQDAGQVANTLKKTVNWNDAGVAAGVPFDNSLPQGAFIFGCFVEIVTPFNGTTPSMVVGTVGAAYNNMVAAADVDETVASVTNVSRSFGRLLAASADVTPYVKLTLTTASAGQAVILVVFEGGWTS